MKRAGPWKLALLLALIGVVVGFARLEGRRQGAKVAPTAPPLTQESDDNEREVKQGRQCLEELTTFLREMGQGWRPVPPLPPVDRLPPLPADLLPAADRLSDPS